MDEHIAIARLKQGDPHGLDFLVQQHQVQAVYSAYLIVGDVELDPFMGSGTTCVAAKKNDRHYVGFDVSAEYCQLAETRLREVGQQSNKDQNSEI